MRDQDKPHRIRSLDLIDMHSGGDVSRIVVGGVGDLPGNSVREQMRYIEQHGDGLRRLLLSEPYGDPHMSVNLVTRPCHEAASAGYIIMEAMGYPMYSGSNTICTATAILESGRVPIVDSGEATGRQPLVLESPAGLAHIVAQTRHGKVESITTQGEPAFVAERDCTVTLPRYGEIHYDIVWSGAFYALVDSAPLGFNLQREEEIALAAFGDEFIRTVNQGFRQAHPDFEDNPTLSFLHFCGPLETQGDAGFTSPSATYVHPGVICRSPTGTGTSARLAQLWARGQISEGQWLDTCSPRGSVFRGTVLGEAEVGANRALHSHITGRARTLAHSRVVVDLDDPLVEEGDLGLVLAG